MLAAYCVSLHKNHLCEPFIHTNASANKHRETMKMVTFSTFSISFSAFSYLLLIFSSPFPTSRSVSVRLHMLEGRLSYWCWSNTSLPLQSNMTDTRRRDATYMKSEHTYTVHLGMQKMKWKKGKSTRGIRIEKCEWICH